MVSVESRSGIPLLGGDNTRKLQTDKALLGVTRGTNGMNNGIRFWLNGD